MISEFVILIVGIIIGQETSIPKLKPILNEMYQKCVEKWFEK
jgi:hypothetical protein